LGRLEAADALLQNALGETPARAPRGAIHHALSISAFHGGGIALAHEHNRAALTHFRARGDRSGQAMALSFAGRLATAQGNPNAALEAIQEALQLARALHFVPLLRSALLNASAALLQVGDYEAAAVYLEEGSKLIQDARDPRTQGLYLTHGSAVLRMRGDFGGTLSAYREALALFDAAHAMHPATFERLNLIDLLLDCGQIVEARDLLAETADLITAHGFSDLHVWLEALRVKWALTADQPVRIATLQIALHEPQRLRVDVRHEALLALAAGQLRLGDSRMAIETSGMLRESPESPAENRARATAILLRAHAQHGSVPAWLQSDAQIFLEDKRVSPLAKLDLQHALAETGDETATLEPRRVLRASVQNLALSLPINLRGAFIARWARASASMRLEAAD
jgi:tetratricopeptide (TPR) repeat protein